MLYNPESSYPSVFSKSRGFHLKKHYDQRCESEWAWWRTESELQGTVFLGEVDLLNPRERNAVFIDNEESSTKGNLKVRHI